ncbi:MAG: aldehyde ferredoxin oxidoreductase family protein, partial [Firmicutes bacterium]|nr:aldehyde ferredoxin oxidoreductase family protein [Bacillota bacterium]
EIKTQHLSEDIYKYYIGGEGLAIKILYDEIPKGADPLGPENVLVFAVGPLQGGSRFLGSGRFAVAAKSPLTNIFGSGLGGGYIAEELKRSGFDAIAITGKSPNPVYLWVNNGVAELKDATHLWGETDAFETEDAIINELGDDKVKVAAIGIAGERLVRYSCITCNYGHGIVGRTGMGTVMGSKGLKAIAFRGTQNVDVADEKKVQELRRELAGIIREAPFTSSNKELGQASAVVPREENGLLPIKNFLEDRWIEGARKIGAGEGQDFNPVLKPRPSACSNCVMGCHRRVTIEEGKYAMDGYGPEYETLAMIGSNCLIDNLLALNKANDLCNRYTIDTIDFGGICAFAMEAYEHGIITKEDLGGIELTWGNADAMLELLEKIAKREGRIPTLLGEGLRIASEELSCPEMAMHVNGAALAAHDPRAFLSMAVSQSISMKGGSHTHGFSEAIELGVTFPEAGEDLSKPLDPHSKELKGLAAAKYQDRMAVANSLALCFFYEFSGVDFTYFTKMLNVVTGWDLTPQDLLKIGERIVCLENMFNIKHGLDPLKDYRLPERMFVPRKEGGAAGVEIPFQEMLDEYFSVKQWKDGIPTKEKLE